jgi:UDP-glucose 4-epimerase
MRFDLESNLLPTLVLLEQMVKNSVKRIVYLSSGGSVYGMSADRHNEFDQTYPINSYGVIKVAIEKYLFMFAHQYSILPLVIRLSNPYGPYHTKAFQGFVNVALRAALCGRVVQVWGDGNNRKDYIFIENAIDSILDLVDSDAWGEIVNVGSGNEYSLNEILSHIKDIVPEFRWEFSESHASDTKNFSLNISKLEKLTSKQQPTLIQSGIRQTYRWLLDHPNYL